MKTYRFKIFGHDYETRVVRKDEEEIVVSINGQEYKAYLQQTKRRTMAKPTEKIFRPQVGQAEGTKITAVPTEAKGPGAVKSPMPGILVKFTVKPGDKVKTGQTILILEAMKMQNNIQSNVDGTVEKISVNEGDSVLEGQELMAIVPD